MKLKHLLSIAILLTLTNCGIPVTVSYQDEQGNTYAYSEKGGLGIAIESNK